MKISDQLYRLRHWETWHYLVKYIPISPAWLWYCFRSGSLWFFTPSNPTLTFGGFEGERKSEMYKQLPPCTYPESIFISQPASFDEVKSELGKSNLQFPLAVKPDAGMMGFMFRKLNSFLQLEQYHNTIQCDYIIQELIAYPEEVSVFYYRYPGEQKGHITGFIKKELLQVIGNGESTVRELIEKYDRTRFRTDELLLKHHDNLGKIIPAGETYILSNALNLSRGGKLISLEHEKDARLLGVFDKLSHHAEHFYYGRYDIKCSSIGDLKKGINYSILEFNGCGAEPHHIYGNGNNLLAAYSIVLHHWHTLYKISRINRRNGTNCWSFKTGYQFLKDAKKHFKTLKKMDVAFHV